MITGGTGSFGKALVAHLITRHPELRRIIIYSRDELKQLEMRQRFPHDQHPQLRFFIGDVRDIDRLNIAMTDVDYVVHAAALKQVPAAEYNPFEAVKTNVLGAENVVSAATANRVKKVVALSTDKACAPINLYGATKLCSDKIFVAANNIRGKLDIAFSVVRYGNVMGSRGSVIPFFLKQRETGVLPITDKRMTRFNILLSEAVDLVMGALGHSLGGELFVKKIPSYRITDLATAIGPDCEQKVVGIRAGEKLHEEMITQFDSLNTIETDDHFIIAPQIFGRHPADVAEQYRDFHKATAVKDGFRYSSDANDQWLTVEQLRTLIQDCVDAD